MNYQKHYDALIKKAKENPKQTGYVEIHHIIPRCLGGSDKMENLVALGAREHCLAHLLLAKIHGGSLWSAVHFMLSTKAPNSRAYKIARERHAEFMSMSMVGEGNHMHGKTGSKAPMFGKKHSDETKAHWSRIRKGRKQSAETIAKRSEKLIADKNGYFKGVIIGTNIKTGETIELCGEKSIKQAGFLAPKVYMCVNGLRKKHKGYVFKRISRCEIKGE